MDKGKRNTAPVERRKKILKGILTCNFLGFFYILDNTVGKRNGMQKQKERRENYFGINSTTRGSSVVV
jgi:hypothetical protein